MKTRDGIPSCFPIREGQHLFDTTLLMSVRTATVKQTVSVKGDSL